MVKQPENDTDIQQGYNNPTDSLNEISSQLRTAFNDAWRLIVQPDDAEPPLSGLSILQFRYLTAIYEHPGEKINNIASLLGLSISTVSRTIDRLVRDNLVVRISDENDRRIIRIYLTDAAKSSLTKLEEKRTHRLEASLRMLPQESVMQILQSLELLVEATQKTVKP